MATENNVELIEHFLNPLNDKFIVDLPNPHDLEAEWIEVASFDSFEEALAFTRKHFGSDDQGCIGLITRIGGE